MSAPPVLILTDDPELGRTLSETLRLWRYAPVVEADPSGLLRRAAERAPAGLVVDTGTRHVDGLDVVRALRVHPATAQTVAVALLPDLREELVELARGRGCDRATTQPIDPDWIAGEIDRLHARRAA